MTPEMWERAADVSEDKLGLADHARVIVLHRKKGREHAHVVWSRINPDTMKATHMGRDYRTCAEIELRLSMEFGHKVTARGNLSKERAAGIIAEYVPPDQINNFLPPTPVAKHQKAADYEYVIAVRTGLDLHGFREQIRAIKDASDSPQAFISGIKAAGVTLCQGRRGFVLMDAGGGEHELGRTLGLKLDEARAFMRGIDRLALPTTEAARAVLKARAAGKIPPERVPWSGHSKHGRKASRRPRSVVDMMNEARAENKARREYEKKVLARLAARSASIAALAAAAAKQEQAAAKGILLRQIVAQAQAEREKERAIKAAERAMREAGRKKDTAPAMSDEELAALFAAQREQKDAARDAERHARIDGQTVYNDKGQVIGHKELQADGTVKVVKRGGNIRPKTTPF
jgi:hypothetical protein